MGQIGLKMAQLAFGTLLAPLIGDKMQYSNTGSVLPILEGVTNAVTVSLIEKKLENIDGNIFQF